MPHYLDPLVRPDSIAVVGASRRPGAVGNTVLENLRKGEFPGALYAVNPDTMRSRAYRVTHPCPLCLNPSST